MDEKKSQKSSRGATQFHQLLIKNLKAYRKKCGYSQMKLAHLCSVSPNYIGEIEMGRKFPSADTMDKIIDALNLKPYQLFFSEEDISGVDQILQSHYEQAKHNVASYVAEALRAYQATPQPEQISASPKTTAPVANASLRPSNYANERPGQPERTL